MLLSAALWKKDFRSSKICDRLTGAAAEVLDILLAEILSSGFFLYAFFLTSSTNTPSTASIALFTSLSKFPLMTNLSFAELLTANRLYASSIFCPKKSKILAPRLSLSRLGCPLYHIVINLETSLWYMTSDRGIS